MPIKSISLKCCINILVYTRILGTHTQIYRIHNTAGAVALKYVALVLKGERAKGFFFAALFTNFVSR